MNKKWPSVIVTDDKSFNLNGPDGHHYCYRDLRKEQQLPSRGFMGGDGVMIWRGVGYYGKLEIKFITGQLNSKIYIETIDEQVNTYTTRIGNKYIFEIPDLNILENCWQGSCTRVQINSRILMNLKNILRKSGKNSVQKSLKKYNIIIIFLFLFNNTKCVAKS